MTEQLAPAATVPPVYETVELPDTAVKVPPVQVVLALDGVAKIKPDGMLSVKSKPVAATVLAALSIANVNVTTPLITVGFGENTLLNPG